MLKLKSMDKLSPARSNIFLFKDFSQAALHLQGELCAKSVLITGRRLYSILNLPALTALAEPQPCPIILRGSGEKLKSFGCVETVIKEALEFGLGRNDTIIAAGGGNLTDLGAFCASIYKRGARLILIPTTLLAMIDAAVGGKTAVNLGGFKNCAGTFYPADEIIICPEFLRTLPVKEIENGLFEALKYGVLFSKTMLDEIFENQRLLKKYRAQNGFGKREAAVQAANSPIFFGIIKKCVEFKTRIVKKDPFDKNERLALNFGHTFGHAFESVSGGAIPHGAAVGLGMAVELIFAKHKYGGCEDRDKITAKLINFIRRCSHYAALDELLNTPGIFRRMRKFISNDKKASTDGHIEMPIVKKAGLYKIEKISLHEELEPFLNSPGRILNAWRE
ncbi:MAG TPA: 3-dehydroquinate synthase family protein [Candidatus Wallbacteria bacterium]|nr:MAG: 2-deoxy-scyllo-inosose synthase [bacterium ADurb.Bin243]HPG57266.1 3-dehydroquinate synthase family protein [Candidatus Wallbacteria bacterium]